MWLSRERLSDFREKIICKQFKLRVNLILHRVDSLICTPKKQHSQKRRESGIWEPLLWTLIMALDHSRLGLENKFLENKSGRIFCVRQVYFTKSCQQVWGRVNEPFILFIHHIWGETVQWGAVFIIQTSDRTQYFTILQYKLQSFNIQDDRSTRGFLVAKPLKKTFQNHLYD